MTFNVSRRTSLTKINVFEAYQKVVSEAFIHLKMLHKSLLDDFVDVKVLTFSFVWIIRSFFENQRLSRYKNLGSCTLNNSKKTAEAFGIIY